MSLSLHFDKIQYSYPDAVIDIFEDLDFHVARGWTGIVGSNGAGKSTILRLATGELEPVRGSVRSNGLAIYCPQRTDLPPPFLDELLESTEGRAWELRGLLEIEEDWLERWGSLSHGERKRAQIGGALWREPDLLALDEPTNHLDTNARSILISGLQKHRGIGLIATHDRELLDSLCTQCLFVTGSGATLRPGGYSAGLEQSDLEQEDARAQLSQARKDRRRLEQEASKRRDLASRSHQLRSKRGIPIKDHDARAKKNLARVSGKDGQAGRLLNQMSGRVEQARVREEGIQVEKKRKLGLWLPGSRSRRDTLFQFEERFLPFGETQSDVGLETPTLVMRPSDRIALVGPNGGGKSTLLRAILDQLDIPDDKLIYLAQETSESEGARVIEEARSLPREELGRMMAVVSHLGSDPPRLLASPAPSPGEVRKLLLAIGIARIPQLIIMDEPTNHLDLPSVECLESALEECPCGLLLVSHDRRFLEHLTEERWVIEQAEAAGRYRLELSRRM